MAAERYPQDTDKTKYLISSFEEETSLYELMEQAEIYFPGVDCRDITISHEQIQFRCFGYDIYDSSDYLWYWVFRKIV